MNTRSLLALAIWPVILALAAAGQPLEASQIPDADYLAAALQQQEDMCGSSLVAEFAFSSPAGSVGSEKGQVHYVRTPNVLYLEERLYRCQADGSWLEYSTEKHSYGRTTREYRSLAVRAKDKKAGGALYVGGPHRLGDLRIMDTGSLYVLNRPLACSVRSGSVQAETQTIAGHECWRVDIPGSKLGADGTELRLWLDPEVGYCPRRLEVNANGKTGSVSFCDYREVSAGVWFPWRIALDVTPGSYPGLELNAQTVRVGAAADPQSLAVSFVSGTPVSIVVAGEQRVLPAP